MQRTPRKPGEPQPSPYQPSLRCKERPRKRTATPHPSPCFSPFDARNAHANPATPHPSPCFSPFDARNAHANPASPSRARTNLPFDARNANTQTQRNPTPTVLLRSALL
jgi:hypothetical protein